MKADGYRIIDDSDREKAANLEQKIIPLSSLLRGIVVLFAQHVQQVIATSRIKMNKEGNRLLRWMPKIVSVIGKKVDKEVVELLTPYYHDAFEAFYGRVGKMSEVSPNAKGGDSAMANVTPVGRERIPALSFPSSKVTNTAPTAGSDSAGTVQNIAQTAPKPPPPAWATAPTPKQNNPAAANATALAEAIRARETAEAASRIYRSLVGASSNRCVRNAETMLEEVNRLFNATATCLMVKVPQGDGFTIHANAGKRLSWGDGGGEGFPVSSSVLTRCLQQRTAVSTQMAGAGDPSASMVMHQIEAAAAAPVMAQDDVVGILYVDRRNNPVPFEDHDCEGLQRLADIFREFPDLVFGQAR
jgi:hypothetical protein